MQKHVNLVDLVKSFPTNIFLQNLASIQKRTSPVKFAHLAEKSEKGSISNLSTKLCAAAPLLPLMAPATDPDPAEPGSRASREERSFAVRNVLSPSFSRFLYEARRQVMSVE